jgi:MFS family permease
MRGEISGTVHEIGSICPQLPFGLIFLVMLIPFFGVLADHIGRKPIMMGAFALLSSAKTQ